MSKFQSVKFLSAQEELEYAKLAAAGDKGAKEKLILSNIPFVAYCARSYRGKRRRSYLRGYNRFN